MASRSSSSSASLPPFFFPFLPFLASPAPFSSTTAFSLSFSACTASSYDGIEVPTSAESASCTARFSSNTSVSHPSSLGPQNMPTLSFPPTFASLTSIPLAVVTPGRAITNFLPTTMFGALVTTSTGSAPALHATLQSLSLSFFGMGCTSRTSQTNGLGFSFSFFDFFSFFSFFSSFSSSSSLSFLDFFFFSPNISAISSA
mmetsp:Transcript_62284/g.157399  ORF Transcript_62284/g.157399 Transcript_62284/m.157399 type:complete len:201 (-) Transcript_62284:376-978(-)